MENVTAIITELHRAACELAARCDGAHTEDSVGYSKADSFFGRQLASAPPQYWNEVTALNAWRMLRKYRSQLASYGVDFDSIPEPKVIGIDEAVVRRRKREHIGPGEPGGHLNRHSRRPVEEPTISVVGGQFAVRGIKRLLDSFKSTVDGRKWDGPSLTWFVVPEAAVQLYKFASQNGVQISDEAIDLMLKYSEVSPRRIEVDGDNFQVYFPLNFDVLSVVRSIDGARFDGNVIRWTIPATPESTASLLSMAVNFQFELSSEFFSFAEAKAEAFVSSVEASRATDADLHVEGLGGELFGFQRAGVAYVMDKKRCIIADDMGVGKTIQALASMQVLNAFPAVVVCPATVKLNWAKEAMKWLPGRTVTVLDGQSQTNGKTIRVAGRDVSVNSYRSDIVITNYEILSYHLDQLRKRPVCMVVADESHYIKNHKAQRTKAVHKLMSVADYRLCLSGTPIKNRPIELVSQLRAIGRLNDFGGFYGFVNRYCAPKPGWGGSMDYTGSSHSDELNIKLRANCYIRRLKSEVLTDLPQKMRSVIPFEITNRPEYDKASMFPDEYLAERVRTDPEIRKALEAIAEAEGIDLGQLLDGEALSAKHRAQRALHLVRISILKQIAAKGKLKAVVDWVKQEVIERGERIVIFAYFRSTQRALMDAFPDAAHVLGEDSMSVRQANVERFQSESGPPVCVCSLAAASEGITLTAARNVAFVEYGWTPSEHRQAEDRVHRIGQDADMVNAYYLSARDTIDEEIAELIARKTAVVEAVADGTCGAETSVVQEVLALLNDYKTREK